MEYKGCPAEVFVKFDRRQVSIFVHKLNEHDVQPVSYTHLTLPTNREV